MKPPASRILSTVTVAAAILVAAATVVQAIRQDSWAPIWLAGWLPATLLAISATCRPPARKRD